MSSHASAAPHHESKTSNREMPYISNPFFVTVEGVKRLFSTNQTAAIVILAISIVMALLQFMVDFIRIIIQSAGENSSSSSGRVLGANTDDAVLGAVGGVALILIVIGVLLVFMAVNTIFMVFWKGFLSYVALCSINNKKASLGEGFSLIGKHFWALLVAEIVMQLKIFGGLLLFIVPGIRAALRYEMAYIYIFDKKVSGMQSLRAMKEVTKGRIIEIFGARTIASFANIIPGGSQIASLGANITQYQQLVHTYEAKVERPKVHWLNYLGFMILAFVLLIVIGFALLIILAVVSNK